MRASHCVNSHSTSSPPRAACRAGVPVIVTRNAWTMPQERYNTQWVRERGLGLVLPSLEGIRGAVQTLLADLDRFRDNVRRVDNRAVFEVPQILSDILAGAGLGATVRQIEGPFDPEGGAYGDAHSHSHGGGNDHSH